MTHEQIEKAAAEELKSIAERYVWFDDQSNCGIENSALPDIESFLTRFSQQIEADALERAADVAQRAQPPKAGGVIAFRIRLLKPKAL